MRKKFLITFLFFAVFLVGSAVYAFSNADKLGATPQGSLSQKINVTTEQAANILVVLKKVGIDEIKSIQHDPLLDNANIQGEKGYRLIVSDIQNVILYLSQNSSVHKIKWADKVLYDKGKVVANLYDFVFTTKEMSDYQYNCQESIKKLLKSPKSAKFPSINDWLFHKDKDVITIQGYVDAQNGFGADTRSDFQFVIKQGKITSLIFDGKEHM